VTRFQFVADHSQRYGVKRLCQIIGVSRSSFYYWRSTATARAARDAADRVLAEQITAVHQAFDGTYGALRITAELSENGPPVNCKRVARAMRRFGVRDYGYAAAPGPRSRIRPRRRHRT
jgi:HTH-like domain